jgi:hypothetical protein
MSRPIIIEVNKKSGWNLSKIPKSFFVINFSIINSPL